MILKKRPAATLGDAWQAIGNVVAEEHARVAAEQQHLVNLDRSFIEYATPTTGTSRPVVDSQVVRSNAIEGAQARVAAEQQHLANLDRSFVETYAGSGQGTSSEAPVDSLVVLAEAIGQ